MRKIRLNFSTCPNDTFMFDAMVNKKIDCEGLEFETYMCDIEELNHIAINEDVDVSKLSYAAFPSIKGRFKVLNCGSALGYGSGPLLVSKRVIYPDELQDVVVAIPGERTTANRLLDSSFSSIKEKRNYLFSDIMDAVLSDEVDAGVLIHEERFTYSERGLRLIADLGELWEQKYGLPIPLGAIVVNRELDEELQHKIDRVLHRSIKYALDNPLSSRDFVKRYARNLTDRVIESHIAMFVNEYSLNIGTQGRRAVETLINIGDEYFV